jgi:hypothetical protein
VILTLICAAVGLCAALTGAVGAFMSAHYGEAASALVLCVACVSLVVHMCLVLRELLSAKPVATNVRFYREVRSECLFFVAALQTSSEA